MSDRTCDTCYFCDRPPYKSPCSECDSGSKWEKNAPNRQTNADRIRAMTDEEMAHYFSEQPDACPGRAGCSGKNCYDCWLAWLKQEASE